jgi:RIO-like serine/threonine protein kinase
MKKILKDDEHSKVTREGDRVIKEFTVERDIIDKTWFSHYQAFSDLYGGVVKLYEANRHHIVMDYVEGESLMSILYAPAHRLRPQRHLRFSYKCFAAMLQSLANMAEFSSTINSVWFHSDAAAWNFRYSKNKFILIDPDAFDLMDDPYPGTFVSALHPLHSILNSIHHNSKKMHLSKKSPLHSFKTMV